MLNKKEIKKAKGWLSALDIKSEFEAISKEIILQYIAQLEADNYESNNRLNEYIEERRKLNKMINEMAKQLAGIAIWNNEKEEPLILGDKKEVKQYFEEKVEG